MARLEDPRARDARRRPARPPEPDTSSPEPVSPRSWTDELAQLQRSAGNQAVLRVLARRQQLRRSTQNAVMNLGGEGSGDKRKRDGQNQDIVKYAPHSVMLTGPAGSRQNIFHWQLWIRPLHATPRKGR